MNLYCNCYECLYQDPENRLCKKDASEIFIDEEGECSEYFCYTLAEEYRQEFYIARKDGFKEKRYGKKIELSGHTFFYMAKELTDYTLITEENTGVDGFYYGFKKFNEETLKIKIDCMLKEHGYVKDKYDLKHKRCEMCKHHSKTPCGSVVCLLTNKCCNLRAKWCKHFSYEQRRYK